MIDKTILADCKGKHENLAMAWVDYKKAYDMAPRSCIIECLKVAQVSENVINSIEITGELADRNDIVGGNVRISKHSKAKFSVLFVICMIPLTFFEEGYSMVYIRWC